MFAYQTLDDLYGISHSAALLAPDDYHAYTRVNALGYAQNSIDFRKLWLPSKALWGHQLHDSTARFSTNSKSTRDSVVGRVVHLWLGILTST